MNSCSMRNDTFCCHKSWKESRDATCETAAANTCPAHKGVQHTSRPTAAPRLVEAAQSTALTGWTACNVAHSHMRLFSTAHEVHAPSHATATEQQDPMVDYPSSPNAFPQPPATASDALVSEIPLFQTHAPVSRVTVTAISNAATPYKLEDCSNKPTACDTLRATSSECNTSASTLSPLRLPQPAVGAAAGAAAALPAPPLAARQQWLQLLVLA